jgi:hypothetical protein
MRAMLAAKTRKSQFRPKFYGTTKRKQKSRDKKPYINQYAAFFIAIENGGCYYF